MLKLNVFSRRPQSAWGITDASPLNWRSAVFELAGLERNPTPSMRLHALVRTAKAIYTEFNLVLKPKLIADAAAAKNSITVEDKNVDIDGSNRGSVRAARLATNNKPSSGNDPILGADDLVPIFIYVMCQCYQNLKHPITNRDLLWSICLPDQLHGEAGYYLTLYESAVEFIIQEPFHAEEGLLAEESTRQTFIEESRDPVVNTSRRVHSQSEDSIVDAMRSVSTDSMNGTKNFMSSARKSVVALLTAGKDSTSTNLDKSRNRFESGMMKFDTDAI